jgi:hypothetical protein
VLDFWQQDLGKLSVIRKVISAFVVGVTLLGMEAGWAHHFFAVYNFEIQTEFVGTVETLNFRNPHIAMSLKVTGENGESSIIEFIEGAPANMLARKGLTPDKIAVGTEITAFGSPLIDDPSKFFLRRVRLADGSEYE